ncbi:hypothetical protein OSTOST_06995, partial [Ostertagia ostertagi]
VQSERAAVELTAQNYKARCSSLQSELDTSEAVQKDFVQLSQSLQIQLEKIRQSEQEVRWQWEDDVENCSGVCTVVKSSVQRVFNIRFPAGQIEGPQMFAMFVILCLIETQSRFLPWILRIELQPQL